MALVISPWNWAAKVLNAAWNTHNRCLIPWRTPKKIEPRMPRQVRVKPHRVAQGAQPGGASWEW